MDKTNSSFSNTFDYILSSNQDIFVGYDTKTTTTYYKNEENVTAFNKKYLNGTISEYQLTIPTDKDDVLNHLFYTPLKKTTIE